MRCRVCENEKPVEDFCRDSAYDSGYSNRCRACKAESDRRTYRTRTEAHRIAAKVRRANAILNAHDRRKGQEWKDRNARKLLVYAARKSAAKRGLEMAIDVEHIHIPDVCPLLGIHLIRGLDGNRDHSPSIDRIDSTKGYVPGNVWIISYRANRIKNNATADELILLATRLKDYETGRLCRESINPHPTYSQKAG
jgi:hypothetical protein